MEEEMRRGGEAEGIDVWTKRWRELVGRWGKREGGCRDENMESRWVRPRAGISIEWVNAGKKMEGGRNVERSGGVE